MKFKLEGAGAPETGLDAIDPGDLFTCVLDGHQALAVRWQQQQRDGLIDFVAILDWAGDVSKLGPVTNSTFPIVLQTGLMQAPFVKIAGELVVRPTQEAGAPDGNGRLVIAAGGDAYLFLVENLPNRQTIRTTVNLGTGVAGDRLAKGADYEAWEIVAPSIIDNSARVVARLPGRFRTP